MTKNCSQCGSPGHASFGCFSKRRKPLATKRHMRKVGKIGRQWISVRNEWVKKNLPDSGVWHCHYCGCELYLNTLTLDHKLSRGRRPDLRFDLDNLVPACLEDNTAKGSRSDEEYLALISPA